MKSKEFIAKAIDIATNYKTLYVMGCFGAPLTAKNKARYTQNHDYNKQAARTKMINAASEDTFGFDCVCLIKGILWGWNGDKSKSYGGAGYAVNNVPDIGADSMITKCSGVSTTGWDKMTPGEALWCSGHIGIYIGDGLGVECTPAWKNKVQITAVGNIGAKSGYPTRKWTKHGKLPYIDYSDQTATAPAPSTPAPVVNTGNDEKAIWDGLMAFLGNPYGVAGVMGNLYAESGLRANNLQNSYEKSLGYTDTTYTVAVDSGAYSGFSGDSAGYGLAQWTYHTRKAALLAYAKGVKKSIGDRDMQVGFLKKELSEGYKALLTALKNATSVKEASDLFMTQFERPKNQSESNKATRAGYGQKYFDKYGKAAAPAISTPAPAPAAKEVKAKGAAKSFNKALAREYTCKGNLNMRDGAGKDNRVLVVLPKGQKVRNYGYYTNVNGVNWLYVQTTLNGVQYTGHCSAEWLV